MKVDLVALPIVQGYIDLPEGGQNAFLWRLQDYATKHGFEISGMQLPGNNMAYRFRLVRDDLMLQGISEAKPGTGGFDPLRYGFSFYRNVFKHNKLESDDPYRAEVGRLAADFQAMMASVGSVTITPEKSK